MGSLRNKKCVITNIVISLILFTVLVFGFGRETMVVYAQDEGIIRDGYTVENVREMLEENNQFALGTQYLTIYSPDGSMQDVEVNIEPEEQEILSQSGIQTMSSSSFNVQTLVGSDRPDSESIVITIMGDGFTSTQQTEFITAATKSANALIEQYPMNLFKDYFNIYAVEVISAESGVSRDVNKFNWWAPNPSVNNYFGSRYWYDGNMFQSGTERMLYITNESRVKALECPNTVLSVIICNSKRWGGSAGKYAVTSLSDGYENIVAHEFGHAFGDLADEYFWRGREAVNMTKNSNTATVKWNQWVDSSATGIYQIGVHQYEPTGAGANWYRPHQLCKMRFSWSDFCAVCAAELIRLMELKTGASFNTTNLSGNKIRIEKLNLSFSGHMIIPEKLNGRVVTEIGTSAFADRIGITQITIPKTVTTIGTSAFSGLSFLKKVNFDKNSSLKSIGDWAFNNVWIEKITLPSSVTSIGSYAFNSTTSVVWQDMYEFKGSRFLKYLGNESSFTVPNQIAGRKITTVGDSAFLDTQCAKIILSPNIESIGSTAFRPSAYVIWQDMYEFLNSNFIKYLGDRENFNIPESIAGRTITYIDEYAFLDSKCINIQVPSSVTYINECAFTGALNLESIVVDKNNAYYFSENGIMYNKNKTTIINVPKALKGEVILPNSLLEIPDLAFSDCINIISIAIPSNVSNIGEEVFINTKKLISIIVDIDNHFYASQSGVLYDITNWELLHVPMKIKGDIKILDNLVSIPEYSFSNRVGITKVILPDSLIEIKDNAFEKCQKIESITIPSSVIEIGRESFASCNLLGVIIFEGITNVNTDAFLISNRINSQQKRYERFFAVLCTEKHFYENILGEYMYSDLICSCSFLMQVDNATIIKYGLAKLPLTSFLGKVLLGSIEEKDEIEIINAYGSRNDTDIININNGDKSYVEAGDFAKILTSQWDYSLSSDTFLLRRTCKEPLRIKPEDYDFEQQYFFYELEKDIIVNDKTLRTNRLRAGYIEKQYLVLSPRRANAGIAYIEYKLSKEITRLDVELSLWSASELLRSSDCVAVFQYKDYNGNWITKLDLLYDIELTTDRKSPHTYSILFDVPVTEYRFYLTSPAVGTSNNSGRLCIGNIIIYYS